MNGNPTIDTAAKKAVTVSNNGCNHYAMFVHGVELIQVLRPPRVICAAP